MVVALRAVLLIVMFITPWTAWGGLVQYKFTVGTQKVSRLCKEKEIVTVNGQFPGPTIYAHEGDNVVVQVENKCSYNITLHWHGVRQLRSCWSDGVAYVTQCPIMPGGSYIYNFTIIQQEGTLWWHAHISWLRATVHGALVIYPSTGNSYPFPQPAAEFPIILGEWWNSNVEDVIAEAIQIGGKPNESDAITINGQPGNLFPCSAKDAFQISVESGKTYLLRIINAAMNYPFFFKIAKHRMRVVAVDASYTKPYKTKVLVLYPGQTTDILVRFGQPLGIYYMAARVYNTELYLPFLNATTQAIIQYKPSSSSNNHSVNSAPSIPHLPNFTDSVTAYKFSTQLRSLRPSVPLNVDEEMLITQGLGLLSCPNNSCKGPFGGKVVGSFNNISFLTPNVDILQAYYFGNNGVFTTDFPSNPPFKFNYTGQNLSSTLFQPEVATKVKVVKFNSSVQVVFQATGILESESHPIHIHGFDFYVVGQGFGNYDPQIDPLNFNLVDPQRRSTIGVPVAGWAAIRFKADNPGVWFVHCHFDRHSEFGFSMVFLVENGPGESEALPPAPLDQPKC